jgi:hypothetical protein
MPLTAASERVLLIPVVLIVFTMLVVLMVFVMLMLFVMLVILMMLAWLARLVVLMVLTGLRLVYDNHSVRIFCIDIVYVSVAAPVDRLIEVIRLLVAFPLAVAHHSALLLVAVLPCLAVYVAIAVNGIEIAEVELQDVVALHMETLQGVLLLLSAYRLAQQRLRTQYLCKISEQSGCRTRVEAL